MKFMKMLSYLSCVIFILIICLGCIFKVTDYNISLLIGLFCILGMCCGNTRLNIKISLTMFMLLIAVLALMFNMLIV